MRAFLASRVVGGRQQIRAAITFHENGRLVMWPYGYTATDVPSDMTAQDHAAFVTWGRRMAATNGYTPQQASDLYVDTGTTRDYEYGVYRIFGFTFELSPDNIAYQDDSMIGAETGRNREAVLSLMEQGSCPLGVLGRSVRIARCGAFDDDFEVGRGWTSNPDGTDTAPAAVRLQRGNPAATSSSGAKQLSGTPSGQIALVTGAGAGISANANDLDGRTTARSPAIDVPPGTGQRLTFAYVFAHDSRSSTSDHLQAIVERSDGTEGRSLRCVRRTPRCRRCVADSVGLDGSFCRQPDPHPVRGRGWWLQQSRRGRGRRRPDHAPGLSRVAGSKACHRIVTARE